MKKISLKNFLLLVYSFLSLVFLIMIVIIFINLKKATDARNYSNDYNEISNIWTTIRHAQHSFLINYNDDIVFFQTEQNKNIRKSQVSYSYYISIVDSLKLTNYVLRNDLHEQLMISSDYISKGEDVFEQISHKLFLRGSQKTGIIGDCNAYYNLAYNHTTDLQMKIYLSKLNDYFLKYLNSPNQIYFQNFLSVYTQMNVYITNNSFSDTNQIDSNIIINGNTNFSTDFINSTNSFKKSFLKLVSLDKKIFLNNQANLMSQWRELNSSVFNEFKKGTIEANSLKKKYFEKANAIIFITIAAIALFFIVLSLTFPYFLSSRIKQLHEMIKPLKKGKIPIDKINEIEISSFSDLIEISDNLKQMFFSLKDISVFASEIGNSNFDFNFKPIGESDELGNALILLRDNLKKAQEDEVIRRKEDEIRQWSNSGIAKFSDILRQSAKDIFELSSIIIKELTNYLDANQGGIFILNDNIKDDIKLELASSYAYSKERKKKREFALGEGLIGTCVVEKATIYMTDIPEDYISITSGLGAANPRSLLIVPLKFEENVLGVLEIASFNLLERYQIEFVERVAESIASTVSITKINERTSKLLEKSNIEAEQRSLKEEELRQNLEELQATQERAAQREVELSSLIELINKVAFIVELDIDGNVIEVPDRILLLFGLEKSEITGRHLSEFDFKPNSELAKPEFWQEIIEGEEKKYLQKFVDEEKVYWLNDYIVPFVDASGNVQKFVCVIFDNTEQINNQNVLKKYTDD
ncbi:MAG: GAF domain-containing protein, partial [Bacteroidota bacterium]|nr:GAF domain-containing protein [Bacteroidota bacterium]